MSLTRSQLRAGQLEILMALGGRLQYGHSPSILPRAALTTLCVSKLRVLSRETQVLPCFFVVDIAALYSVVVSPCSGAWNLHGVRRASFKYGMRFCFEASRSTGGSGDCRNDGILIPWECFSTCDPGIYIYIYIPKQYDPCGKIRSKAFREIRLPIGYGPGMELQGLTSVR